MPIHLRRAGRSDLERLVAWSRDFEHGAHGEPFIERTFEVLDENPERGGIYLLEDPEPAGYVILVGFWSNEFRGEALIIDELYIAPEHRGGKGTAALHAIEELARDKGVKLLALEVLPDAPRVHSLYRRAGFESGRTLYQKRLS